MPDADDALAGDTLAIVGLAVQVPGAEDAEEFWLNLLRGWYGPASPASGPPREAAPGKTLRGLTDEVAYAAVEQAGYDPAALAHDIRIFTCPADGSGPAVLELAARSVRAGECGTALVTAAEVDGPGREGGGACAIVIKRLRDAIADHDHIWALIRGIVCVDGPGQAAGAARAAMLPADARPGDISYIEACGHGSAAGHVAALAEALVSPTGLPPGTALYGLGTDQGPVGHLGPVGTLAGLIKVAMALEREQLPASSIGTEPDLSRTPFHAHDQIAPWPRDPRRPRLAVVSALGDDGAGGLVVLAEAPAQEYAMPVEEPRVVVWSGRTTADERNMRERLARYFVWRGEEVFQDAVATLRHGRAVHPVRAAAICTGALDAASVLGAADSPRVLSPEAPTGAPRPVTLLFPARGSALATRGLYRDVPAFARALDGWLKLLDGPDLPTLDRWHCADRPGSQCPDHGLAGTGPALLFAVEAALGQAWREAGVRPSALAGDGIGILAAIVTAGVITPAEAVALLRAAARPASDDALARAVAEVHAKPAAGPVLGAATGHAVTAAELADPAFWSRALRMPASIADGPSIADGLLVTAGPGPELTVTALLATAARLWIEGHDIAWEALGQAPVRHRVPLPGAGIRCAADRPPGFPLAAACACRPRRAPTPVSIDVLTAPGPGPLVLAISYAGGSGRAFQAVRGYLPSGCGLALVDLPGHGRLMGRDCLRDVNAVVDELLAALPTLPTSRLLLLGYSLGGSFCYELAARLNEDGTPPEGMIVCGTRSPQTGVGHPPVAHLPSGEPFLRAAVGMGLAAPEMLELPELAESFAELLQADLAMVETFPYQPGLAAAAGPGLCHGPVGGLDRAGTLAAGLGRPVPGPTAAAARRRRPSRAARARAGVRRDYPPRRGAPAGTRAYPACCWVGGHGQAVAASRVTSAASAWTVGQSKSTLIPSSTPNCSRTRRINWTALSESPPSSKNSSSGRSVSTPRASFHISYISASTASPRGPEPFTAWASVTGTRPGGALTGPGADGTSPAGTGGRAGTGTGRPLAYGRTRT